MKDNALIIDGKEYLKKRVVKKDNRIFVEYRNDEVKKIKFYEIKDNKLYEIKDEDTLIELIKENYITSDDVN